MAKKFNQEIFKLTGKKFTLEDVFKKACDYLEISNDDKDCWPSEKSQYSCDAINWAVWYYFGFKDSYSRYSFESDGFGFTVSLVRRNLIEPFMISNGFEDRFNSSLNVFDDVENPQQARFIWLTWLAMMAEEQGV